MRETNRDPSAVTAPDRPEEGFDTLIERWWVDHFPGSAVARDTSAWNAAHAAKEALKRLLARAQLLPRSVAERDERE
jgi:hypothetical protein